jgi:hypothetical protein
MAEIYIIERNKSNWLFIVAIEQKIGYNANNNPIEVVRLSRAVVSYRSVYVGVALAYKKTKAVITYLTLERPDTLGKTQKRSML